MQPVTPAERPDIDLTDGWFYADGHARQAYRWMRSHEPVFRDSCGLAALSTHRAVVDAERDPQLFTNSGGIRPTSGPLPHMIDMDDPEHLVRRKLVNAGFTRKRVHEREPAVTALCDALIDSVCEQGTCDFVRALAAPLPMAVIGDMLGIAAADHELLLKWSDDLVITQSSTATEEDQQAFAQALSDYQVFMQSIIATRREQPGDDLISVLIHAEVDGRRMTDEQIISETLLILIGGDETTRHTLSGGMAQLLRTPDQWASLRAQPRLIGSAVEEMLRWTSPVKNMCRTLSADADFHGTTLRAGEKVMLLFESANFDEHVFGDPDDFRIDRSPNNHLAFGFGTHFCGFGTHFCLGNQLARLELTVMVERIMARLPDLRLVDDHELPLRPANFVSGPESMPVAFTPSSRLTS